mgnify:CR=1 FL=1
MLSEYEAINLKLAEPMDDDAMAKLMAEMGELQDQIDAADGWELDRMLDIAMDALRCPPGDADVAGDLAADRPAGRLCSLDEQVDRRPGGHNNTPYLETRLPPFAVLDNHLVIADKALHVLQHRRGKNLDARVTAHLGDAGLHQRQRVILRPRTGYLLELTPICDIDPRPL